MFIVFVLTFLDTIIYILCVNWLRLLKIGEKVQIIYKTILFFVLDSWEKTNSRSKQEMTTNIDDSSLSRTQIYSLEKNKQCKSSIVKNTDIFT